LDAAPDLELKWSLHILFSSIELNPCGAAILSCLLYSLLDYKVLPSKGHKFVVSILHPDSSRLLLDSISTSHTELTPRSLLTMPIEDAPSSVTYASGAAEGAPDLRILHYNDVYHIEER